MDAHRTAMFGARQAGDSTDRLLLTVTGSNRRALHRRSQGLGQFKRPWHPLSIYCTKAVLTADQIVPHFRFLSSRREEDEETSQQLRKRGVSLKNVWYATLWSGHRTEFGVSHCLYWRLSHFGRDAAGLKTCKTTRRDSLRP
eukprot:scaffold293_cov267-Prasinococcus_capsulatus_cf.AAC.4